MTAGSATADSPSSQYLEDGSRVVSVDQVTDRIQDVTVYAASMDRNIPLWVMLPADRSVPRPTLYLLNGIGGGEDNTSWEKQTDIVEFFADKNVNIVMPMAGRGTWYTDWQQDEPSIGRNKWSTFLGRELPPLMDELLGTNKRQSVAGISSSSSSILNLAIEHPGVFTGVAGYSGCMQSADPAVQQFIKTAVEGWPQKERDVTKMWGPVGGPGWVAHDPEVEAEKLRGTQIYLSTGTGIPGYPHDTYANPRIQDGRAAMFDQLVVGGPIEAATAYCTHRMASRLSELGIPAVIDFRPIGTHSWGYWEDDLHKSWPWLAGTLGLE